MSDTDRVLGKLEEFKDSAEKRFDKIELRFDEIETSIESIQYLKWKIVGGVTVLSFIVGTIANVIVDFAMKRS